MRRGEREKSHLGVGFWRGQLVYLCISELSQVSLSAGRAAASPCLLAYVAPASQHIRLTLPLRGYLTLSWLFVAI